MRQVAPHAKALTPRRTECSRWSRPVALSLYRSIEPVVDPSERQLALTDGEHDSVVK
jgi:hypothetical protein